MFAKIFILTLSLLVCVSWTARPYQFTVYVDGPKCWPGKEIHDPCDGWLTGCTKDGILVS
jgi:hypothetical protein